MPEETAYQSLYRRFRPQTFSEMAPGQDHVTTALRNAVREGRVGHAYLFSGPRGTGKTTTARILAKALNCEKPSDGEPCDACPSCLAITSGSSLDVQELDAASNNGVDAIRDLVSRVALATPGRWKVYIVDEVHMLSTPASNALLKTLEEPPAHVVFVLATTDPQKVLPTIRSRTQHYEFRLYPSEALAALVRGVAAEAGLEVDDATIELVTRRGAGSARDALSALEVVVAGGGAPDEVDPAVEIVAGLAARDAGATLVAVARALAAGRDARRIGESVLARLRTGFLALLAPDLELDARDGTVEDQARQLGAAGITRALEVVGDAVTSMKEAVDARVALETALVRVARTDLDVAPSALLERIERLERGGGVAARPAEASVAAEPKTVAPPPAPRQAAARPPLRMEKPASAKVAAPPAKATAPAPSPEPIAPAAATPSAAPPTGGGAMPDRDALTLAWGDVILDQISARAKALFRGGRWVDAPTPTFALPTEIHRKRCEEVRLAVQETLSKHFGTKVVLTLVVDDAGPAAAPAVAAQPKAPEPDDVVEDVGDVSELEDAPPVASGAARLLEAFPGAVEEPHE